MMWKDLCLLQHSHLNPCQYFFLQVLFFPLSSKAGYSPHCNYVPCKLINLSVNTATLAALMHIHEGLHIHEQMSDQTLSEP